jgi:apolipoprotein N-acyltransferase
MTLTPAIKPLGAVLSGLLLTAAFPPGNLDWFAWFALVPLLTILAGEAPARAFRWGLIMGLTHYLTLIYWIVVVLKHYGGLNVPTSVAALGLLALYLALYPALFAALSIRLWQSRFFVVLTASLWVGLEYIRASILTGFPWCLLGYAQYKRVGLIQIADQVGVYGLSFLIVFANAFLYRLLIDRSAPRRRLLFMDAPLILCLAAYTLLYGQNRLSTYTMNDKTQHRVRTAIIQGNIDQSIKWNPRFQAKTLQIYRSLSRSTLPFAPQLIVWPETSVPFFFQDRSDLSVLVAETPRELGAHLIFGSPAYDRSMTATTFYNRAYHLSPDGESAGYYDKIHLVPFGEYVPLQELFPFIHRLVIAAGDFEPGDTATPLKLPFTSAGPLICFEIIFPELARMQAQNGAQILVNLTNDAWYGMTSAPYQHLSMAVFRAVETKRPLIRAANTGISAFISPLGHVVDQSDIFTEAVLERELVLPSTVSPTFYVRFGDLFALLALFSSMMYILGNLCYNLIEKKSSTRRIQKPRPPG